MLLSRIIHCRCKHAITAKDESNADVYCKPMDSTKMMAFIFVFLLDQTGVYANVVYGKESLQLRGNVDLAGVDIFYYFFQKQMFVTKR